LNPKLIELQKIDGSLHWIQTFLEIIEFELIFPRIERKRKIENFQRD
jgi:hypothetical protein